MEQVATGRVWRMRQVVLRMRQVATGSAVHATGSDRLHVTDSDGDRWRVTAGVVHATDGDVAGTTSGSRCVTGSD
eukprot:365196-Chlamydomonas_euryale.AAC.5